MKSNPINGIISAITLIAMVAVSTSCGSDGADSAEKFLLKLDKKAEQMKSEILSSKSTIDVNSFANVYYISAEGDDQNDGRSPESALKSLQHLNGMDLQPGDCVLFRRGDMWRGQLKTKQGVTYSAYGDGEKPRLYGSPYDAAVEGNWIATETENVYMYDGELPNDIGTLVFNHGEAHAFKVMKVNQEDGTTLHIDTGEPFASYRDLKRDLDFYHDYKEAKRVYLYSTKGNPAERFSSIELSTKGHIIVATNGVTIDNLCLKYCGSHGIGCGTTSNLTVTNCELGWIGGSIQSEGIFGRNYPTRYGNAIEIYGGCENFTVMGCYIYQIYDAAITHQHQGDVNTPLTMRNVLYANNLIEDCVYSIEYFLGREDTIQTHFMDGILIANNIMRRAGYGWGNQRPDKETPAHIKSWSHHTNRASNFRVENNIFDRSTRDLLNIAAAERSSMPTLVNNTYIQPMGAKAGSWGSEGKTYIFDESVDESLGELFGEEQATIIYAEE